MKYPFYTIGHSTRPIQEFLELLAAADVTSVADVRTAPGSRAYPQYGRDSLRRSLAAAEIEYEHLAELGGLRSRQKDKPRAVNAFWENDSFHNYADYAMSDQFRTGLARLLEIGRSRRCAIMCAEAVWWRCHRRIIADYLLVAGEKVYHIMGLNNIVPASLTEAARVNACGVLTYPAVHRSA